MNFNKNILGFALFLLSEFLSADEILFGEQMLGRLRADSTYPATGTTLFILDNAPNKRVYVFKFLARPDTPMSKIARKVLGNDGVPVIAQDVKCSEPKPIKDWEKLDCELIDNSLAKFPTYYE